jgi:hypothetical protein
MKAPVLARLSIGSLLANCREAFLPIPGVFTLITRRPSRVTVAAMITPIHPDENGLFPVLLISQVVVCDSREDANAVAAANSILTGDDPIPYSRAVLEQFADVLLRYGRPAAADVLREAAQRQGGDSP